MGPLQVALRRPVAGGPRQGWGFWLRGAWWPVLSSSSRGSCWRFWEVTACGPPGGSVGRAWGGGIPLTRNWVLTSQAPSAPGLQTDSLRTDSGCLWAGPVRPGAWEPREVPGALAEGGGGGGWFFTPESEAGGAGPVTWPWGGAWEPVLAESCPTTNQLLTDRASPDPLSHAHGRQCPPLLAGHGPSRPGLCVRPFPLACEPRRPSAAHRCVRGGQGRGAVHPADLQPL